MTDRPSDRATAKAFWNACDTVNLDRKALVDLLHRIELDAREIDAAALEGAQGAVAWMYEYFYLGEWRKAVEFTKLDHTYRYPDGKFVKGKPLYEHPPIYTTPPQPTEAATATRESGILFDGYVEPTEAAQASVCLVNELRLPHFASVEIQLREGYEPKIGDRLYWSPTTTEPAQDREDAELVPIVWRTQTPFGTGYKFSEEFLAQWPDFDAARAAGGGGRD